jgi:type I restriction enzyme S subunit
LQQSPVKLSKIQLSLPSLAEQTKIANFLSAINKKIEKVGIQIQGFEQWKKGLLQQLFV